MSATATVTDRDVRHLLRLIDEAAPIAGEEFPSSVLFGLREVIPSTDITFQLMDARTRWLRIHQVDDNGLLVADGDEDELDELFWSAFWEYGGCSYPQDSGDYTTVWRRSDRLSDREYAETAMGGYMRAVGARHEVLVPLPPQGFVDRRLLLFRDEGPDFSDREVLLLRMLRPHLDELHKRQQRHLSGQPELTARQWEILRRVSAGSTNAQVARALNISPATVRKHLENIFVRLDVASRTEAVSRVVAFLDAARPTDRVRAGRPTGRVESPRLRPPPPTPIRARTA